MGASWVLPSVTSLMGHSVCLNAQSEILRLKLPRAQICCLISPLKVMSCAFSPCFDLGKYQWSRTELGIKVT